MNIDKAREAADAREIDALADYRPEHIQAVTDEADELAAKARGLLKDGQYADSLAVVGELANLKLEVDDGSLAARVIDKHLSTLRSEFNKLASPPVIEDDALDQSLADLQKIGRSVKKTRIEAMAELLVAANELYGKTVIAFHKNAANDAVCMHLRLEDFMEAFPVHQRKTTKTKDVKYEEFYVYLGGAYLFAIDNVEVKNGKE